MFVQEIFIYSFLEKICSYKRLVHILSDQGKTQVWSVDPNVKDLFGDLTDVDSIAVPLFRNSHKSELQACLNWCDSTWEMDSATWNYLIDCKFRH